VTAALQAPAIRTRRRVRIVLPAYNEAARIGKLFERLEDAMVEGGIDFMVIVVDDGSRDATAEVAKDWAQRIPVQLLQHETNLGLGATIRDGLFAAAASSSPRDIVVTMDADDTHTPGLILRMSRMILEGHDVVIASRYQDGAHTIGVPSSRRLFSWVASWLFRALLPIPGVRDFTSGYRAYRAEVLQQAIAEHGARFVDQEGFQCMVDILLKLRSKPLVFGEVPLILRYDLKEGASKMNVSRTIAATLKLLVRNLRTR
jgi:dolichol-phosphate mannosyltransferase